MTPTPAQLLCSRCKAPLQVVTNRLTITAALPGVRTVTLCESCCTDFCDWYQLVPHFSEQLEILEGLQAMTLHTSRCVYVVTRVGRQPYRCHRETAPGSHLCSMHQRKSS